jgi:hypothetical protein
MKAIVVTDQAAGTAGVQLMERPEPQAAINDVAVAAGAAVFPIWQNPSYVSAGSTSMADRIKILQPLWPDA